MEIILPLLFLIILQPRNCCMERERYIKDLQQRIEMLSKNMENFQQELQRLQAELNALHGETGTTNSAMTGHREEFATSRRSNTGLENYIGLRFMHIIGIVVL